MTSINIFSDAATNDASITAELFRWSFCYLHGNAEFEYDHENGIIPDIFLADTPRPDVGNHLVFIEGKPALAVIAVRHGHINGRIALLDDTDALTHALDVKSWQ